MHLVFKQLRGIPLFLLLVFLGSSCSHVPPASEVQPQVLLEQACEPGSKVASVKGFAWLQAKSKDASGQFPAMIDARAPDHLELEVNNLLGGTEAIIRVDGRRYKIEIPSRKDQSQVGVDSWGGIPLQWATELFLGRIPCPSPKVISTASLTVAKNGELVVETQPNLGQESEKFTYTFKSWGGRHWPGSLRWERRGLLTQTVEFKFDDPEDETHSPKKWEAKSSQGEVKVRWRGREREMVN